MESGSLSAVAQGASNYASRTVRKRFLSLQLLYEIATSVSVSRASDWGQAEETTCRHNISDVTAIILVVDGPSGP
jgi:hypothetical protein